MAYLSEAAIERVVLDQLSSLGYGIATDAEIGPDGKTPEREAYADVVLAKRLTAAIERLNPAIPAEARGDALRKVLATEKPSLVEENRRLHKLMVEGVDVEFYSEDGTIRGDKVRLIDFDDCGFGWFLYDFATGVSFMEDHPQVPALKKSWVEGYRTVRDLPAADEAEIDTFVMLRRMALLAWIGSHREVEIAIELAPVFAEGTAKLAESYFSTHG